MEEFFWGISKGDIWLGLVGLVAYVIYRRQQYAKKVDAAQILLDEINHAEKVIAEIRTKVINAVVIEQNTEIFPGPSHTGSWSQLRYSMAGVLDSADRKVADEFFACGQTIQRAIEYFKSNPFTTAQEKNRIIQEDLASKYIDKRELPMTDDERKKTYGSFLSETFMFRSAVAEEMLTLSLHTALLEGTVFKRKLEILATGRIWIWTRIRLMLLGRRASS
jgi:hypothetical protein